MLNNTINFMRWRKPFYVIALVFCLASIASLVVKGLNFSLDFTGGAQVELSYSEPVDLAAPDAAGGRTRRCHSAELRFHIGRHDPSGQ